MLTGEDEPSSGLNGRLRPRKSNIPSPQTIKSTRKTDPKAAQEKPKRTSTPSKASPNKPDDLTNKSDSLALHILCPYCDKTFFTKQAISKHVRRIHILTPNDYVINCLYCNHAEADANDIIRHMVDNHPNQYFACYDCHTRFPSTTELAEHKLNVCEKQKLPYRNKLRPKTTPKKTLNISTGSENDEVENTGGHEFNGLVISCELKPSHAHEAADIEDNITTNFILPPTKNIVNSTVIEKNAVIILDDLQWNKRMPTNFSFHNTDADQILSRLGVVHRSPRAGEFNKRDWSKNIDESNQKFEKCFDTSFYSKVASNVQENLSKFLDGSFNFNPDPENTIKTRRAKNSVAINTVEGFPILLECEQFSRTVFDRYLPRALAPKHKLKWDTLENERNLLNPEQIKRDSHTNNCIISLVSSLDIWTQLCMRQKFEEKFNKSSLEKKTEKQNIIGKELKEILESRELPTSSSQIVKYTSSTLPVREDIDFPSSLGLIPSTNSHNAKPAVLSGEWVRPRCYVCCACGAQTRDSRALSSHISARHPNAQIQHYEIVGDVLLKSDILKHLYVPPNQLNNRTRPLRGIRECTKCKKSISLEDLHQHMLDCAGDTPAVRRKCRYRPFGVRKRRPRLPDNTIRREMRKDIRTQHSRKNHMRPRTKIRTEVGDAETIRKMLADLPAKRHRVTVNPLNPILRPRRKLNVQRNKLLMKKRPTEDIKKKPLLNTEPRNIDNEYLEKSSTEPENSQSNTIAKPYEKNVDSKILGHNETLIKKPTMIKNKRKNVPHKEPQDHCDTSDIPDMTSRPPDVQDSIQIEQLSTQNNTERIVINNGGGGSYKEHGNGSNNGSSNRDNNNSGHIGQHHNSRDSFGPSQNIPLKHSIASLTASSETHDKSVQFHHLFLVQQECNNVTNHVPSGQKMLFENEAVVRKLDKPPLHFNHRGYLDPLVLQKNKLNKPRKGLNDCIAMLKNKLEDPSPSSLPLHVSVQCGSDEPLGPEPIIIERRHSTTESNNESTQRSLQMLYPEVPAQNSVEYQNIPKRPTRRRSTTTRQRQNSVRDKSIDLLPNNDYINWKQYYYESQMLSAQNNKRQPARRKSMTPADDFLLQHAINIELLNKNSRELQNLSDYHYNNLTMPYKPTKTKKNRENPQKSNTKGRIDVEVPKCKNKESPKTREKSFTRTRRTRANSQQMNQYNIKDSNCISVINRNDQYIHHVPASCTYAPGPEKNIDCCTLAAIQEENINVCLERELTHSNVQDGQTLHHINQQTASVVEYTTDNNVHQSLYTIPYESTVSAPLDLSNNIPNNDNTFQYLPPTQFCSVNYEPYETLDLSNKHLNNETLKETDLSSDNVVDLSLRFSSDPPHDTRLSPLPSDMANNDIEDGPTDLSIVRVDDYVPTDLSVRRKNYPFQSCERTVEDISQINYIQDLSPHPIRNVENVCILVPLRESTEENEQPTDLSRSKPTSRPDVTSLCLTEQQDMYLNVFRNNPVPSDDNIPADLSGRINDVQNIQYLKSQVMNVNDGLLLHENIDRQSSLGLDKEQIINLHYNSAYRTSVPTSYDEDSDGFDDRRHNIPTASTISPRSIIHDYSNNNPPLNDSSISHSNEILSYTDRYSEEPLSLTSNSVQLECNSKPVAVCNIMHNTPELEVANYKVNTSIYSLPNDQNCTSPALLIKSPPREKTYNFPVFNNTECSELNMSQFPVNNVEPCHRENNGTNKLLSISNTQNCKEDSSTSTISQENLEQDPETARKIAMLPKELVAILGTMPVDHRNQLLNVLPQYVSTSVTDPNLKESTRSKSDDQSCTPPMKRNTKKDDVLKHAQDKDDSNALNTSTSQISVCPEAPHISVSSSVLLTPPTPHLSDRHSIQSQDNDELKTDSILIRLSTEDRTHFDVSKSDIQPKSDINMSIVKRLTHLESDITEDRIIDLTGDDYLPPNELSDILRDHSSPNLSSKSSSHKVNNDKTASLRAVRIKTQSERHRSILTDKLSVNNTIEKTMIPVNEPDLNKNSELQKPLAIQQAEISSTQHNKINNTNNILINKCSLLHLNNAINQQSQNQLKSTETEHIEIKVNRNVGTEKLNCVTSSIPKDVTAEMEKDVITIPDISVAEKSNNMLKISSLNRKDSVSESNTLNKNIFPDTLSKENVDSKKSLSIIHKKEVHNKEDSEDAPILTHQTNVDSNILSGTGRKIYDAENTVSENEENKQSTNNEIEHLSTKSNYMSETVIENKGSINSKGCSLHNSDGSLISEASNDIINQHSEKQRKLNERLSQSKQNGKRGFPEQALKTKYIETKDQDSNQSEIYKKEIDKENNYYSDEMTNNEKSQEDSANAKVIEKNIEIISAVNAKVCNNIKENIFNKSKRNDSVTDFLEKHPEKHTFKNNASISIKESDKSLEISEIETIVKHSEKPLVSHLTQDSPKIETDISEKYETLDNLNSNPYPLSGHSKDVSGTVNDANNILSNKSLLNSKTIQVVDISSDAEEANTTPVRRSRRGKSIYMHKNNTDTETISLQDTNEPRAPLTKKQLIFSKLLLDEENHNNNKNSNDNLETSDLKIVYKSIESPKSDELDIQELRSNKIKANKRKKSPQSKKKTKKQKSLTSLKTTKDRIDKSQIDCKNKSLEIVVTNIVKDDKTPEEQSINGTGGSTSSSKLDFTSTPEANSKHTKQRTSIEKRKSNSPPRLDVVQSYKPKKCKLNVDEENIILSSEEKRSEKKELTKTDIGENKIISSTFRNTTCYNKPLRRVRSKSVVEKSSGSNMYDPYDIDLEDMVEKTEPFIRKEIVANNCLTISNTSVIDKTSELTASSGDVETYDNYDKATSSESIPEDYSSPNIDNKIISKSETLTKDSDTDESSKSDEPLKKYATEKEKRRPPLSLDQNKVGNLRTESNNVREKSKTRGRKKRTLSSNTKNEKYIQNKNNEEELRSEQFMESFGFFSERKPRKSNLLATKKISETFHIIAYENDEAYFSSLDRVNKKSVVVNKPADEVDAMNSTATVTKKTPARRGRKKKSPPPPEPAFCNVCKKTFRRSDNYTRHQISLYHISKLSEVELNTKTIPIEEEPNYLIVFKQQLDRLKIMQDKITFRKKNCLPTSHLVLPTLQEILEDVKRIIREQILARRGLSRDEALFVDCCEMLKESHKNDIINRRRNCNSFNCLQACEEELAALERSIDDKCDKYDGVVDSITAKNIMESEEVRNLENDLISGLKEANGLKGANLNYHPLGGVEMSGNNSNIMHISNYQQVDDFDVIDEPVTVKSKTSSELKDKMYPDVVENIDIFEDKFDKIKRKCRSQAAAAKQNKTLADENSSHKNRKKSEKKKAKRGSKKNHTTVPTKGALKGFDGIKVSISTSDINMAAIVPALGNSFKKKKKSGSKKKRERKSSDESSNYDSDTHRKNNESLEKKVDVYEFMDTEDTELFEFRPSTLMERFRSISNKEIPGTSKTHTPAAAEVTSESGSDGDDFVYMSDDYLCSDDETENSILSCEFGNVKGGSNEYKKPLSPLKRKDVIEKNAVMGKIFKHNAVRTERRRSKSREPVKTQANMDQLFDSLLEDKPKSSIGPKKDSSLLPQRASPPKQDKSMGKTEHNHKKRNEHVVTDTKDNGSLHKYDALPSTSSTHFSTSVLGSSSKKRKSITPPRKLDLNALRTLEYSLSSSKNDEDTNTCDSAFDYYARSSQRISNKLTSSEDDDFNVPKICHNTASHSKGEDNSHVNNRSKDKVTNDKSHSKKRTEEDDRKHYDSCSEDLNRALVTGDAGVAVQRARRKCTVGKQNVLAETWSSESEPDGAPPRPSSVESVVPGASRKKRGRKREGGAVAARRGGAVVRPSVHTQARPRPPSYWSEGEDEHPQQHGWIVGDSHKKLVTMLAHAKGRKRSGDDKRTAVLE